MVSNRYRSNKSIGNKIVNLDQRTTRLNKKTTDPHLSANAVKGENISDASVTAAALAPDAVTGDGLQRGSVGTENLGVVNQITSDRDLEIVLPGKLHLDGAMYPPPPTGTTVPIVQRDDKGLVQGGIVQTATIHPFWTSGLPTVQFPGGTLYYYTSGWSSGMGKPHPGQVVRVTWDGTAWFIVGAVETGLDYPNQIALTLANGWTQYDATWGIAKATKTSENVVQLSGLIKGGTVAQGTRILTLPEPFWPDYDMIFGVNNSDTTKQILVRKNGVVEIYAGAWGAGTYVSLSQIKYPGAGTTAWSRYGIDAGFTFANSWKSWQFPENWSSTSGGGVVSMTSEVTGGPPSSPTEWQKLAVTTTATSSVSLINGGAQYNYVNRSTNLTMRFWVWSNTASTIQYRMIYKNEAGTQLGTTTVENVSVAANTWQQVTGLAYAQSVGTYRVEAQIQTPAGVSTGYQMGASLVEIYESTGLKSLKNDSGPLRIWKEPTTGQIYLNGVVTGGTGVNGTAITGTFPAAYIPFSEDIFPTVGSGEVYGQFRASTTVSTPASVVTYGSGGTTRLPINAVWRPNTGGTMTWTSLSMVNSWVNYGSPFTSATYAKSPGGMVFIRGLIKNGTMGANIATIPAGYRTKPQVDTSGILATVASTDARGRIDIRGDGSIIAAQGASTWYSLGDTTWVAEQ